MSGLTPLARFMPVQSALNAAAGMYIVPKQSGQVLSVTYSLVDVANKYNPLTNPIQSRLVFIAGKFGDSLANFIPSYDLSSYRVLLDLGINDPGPTPILLPPDAEDGVAIESGEGVTVLLAAPIVSGVTGTLFLSKLIATSKGLITAPAHSLRALPQAQSQSTSSSSGGSGGSGGGGGAGGGGRPGGGRPVL